MKKTNESPKRKIKVELHEDGKVKTIEITISPFVIETTMLPTQLRGALGKLSELFTALKKKYDEGNKIWINDQN